MILIFLNWRYPFIRTSSPIFNTCAMLVASLLPWFMLIQALKIEPISLRPGIAGLSAIAGVALLPFIIFMIFDIADFTTNDDIDMGFIPVSTVEMNGTRICAYQTDGGATTDYGLVVRQELRVVPGIYLVRDLYSEYHSPGGRLEVADSEHIKVYALNTGFPERKVIRVYRYIWF